MAKQKNDIAANQALALASQLNRDQAVSLLRQLLESQPRLATQITAFAQQLLSGASQEELAHQVEKALMAACFGNPDPNDPSTPPDIVGWELFETTLHPFVQDMQQQSGPSKGQLTMHHCMGILQGLYQFYRTCKTKRRDIDLDMPKEFFHATLEDWQSSNQSMKSIQEMSEFVRRNCRAWAK